MKKFFDEPVIDVQKFGVEDVITTSSNLDDNEGDLDFDTKQ